MLDPHQDAQASALLWHHWEQGTRLDALPAAFHPSTRADFGAFGTVSARFC